MEFSKRIEIICVTVAIALSAMAVLFPIWQLATDGITAALPYAWGAASVSTGGYLWKAKNENRSKYAMKYVNKFAEKYGIDAAIRIAEVVLKD